MIVREEKRWEIRKRNTNIRGDVIISEGHALGKAKLVDVLGPFTVEELLRYHSYHKVDEKFLEECSREKSYTHGFLKI